MATVRGTAYERACLGALQDWLKMQLYRTGGKNDGGMDLCGWWAPWSDEAGGASHDARLPSALRVIVQCKAEAKPAGPSIVRELEGTLARAAWNQWIPSQENTHSLPVAPNEAPLVGILATLSGFSKQALLQARSSRLPLVLVHLTSPHPEFAPLACTGFVWNDALAAADGPLRGRFAVRWLDHQPRGPRVSRPALYRDGVAVA